MGGGRVQVAKVALGVLVVAELVAAVVATIQIGNPKHLPAVALDSRLLFHGYRALVLFVALYGVTVLVLRSFGGSLASKIGTSGVEWTQSEAGQSAAEQMTKLNLRLNDQADFIEVFVKHLAVDLNSLKALERKIERVDRDLQSLIPRLVEIERRIP